MRVLHINVNYIMSALHQTMIEHMNRLEIESKVFVPTFDKSRTVLECEEYVTIKECFNKWDRIFYYVKQKKIMDSLLECFDVSEFDCIHAYTLFTDGNVAMQLSKKYGIPYVVAVRNTDVNDFFKKMIHLRNRGVEILQNASRIFFLSPKYRDEVLEKYVPQKNRNEIANKCSIVPNGIDEFWHVEKSEKNTLLKEKEFDKDKLVNCIYVGGIDRNKNVELTMKALSLLENEGWKCRLTCVGKIVDNSIYKRLCKYRNFVYISPKSKEKLIDYYREADIFVMQSHTETFGLVYAEAMSQGLPVIYTKGQGFDGQFEDGEVGYCVDDRDAIDISKKIKIICKDYSRISLRAVQSVSKFDWEKIVVKYEEIYKQIVNENICLQ